MLRAALDSLPASRIREVANAALGREDILKFWFGEADQPTPAFIREAAKQALDAGETFYSHNLGLPELRAAIADYASRLRGARIEVDRVAVTSAGVNALALIAQALLDPGDRVAIVTPVWPNLTAIPRILGAHVIRVPLHGHGGVWTLDLDRLLAAARGARAVIVNSPNNPTGWTMPQPQWDALLAYCRQHGIWLVSDDAYERLVYDGAPCAPGVLAQVDADERFISVNTFSKAWSMTGWRLGWLIGPRVFIAQLAKLIEFNTSCAPPFVQRAGIAALRDGEPLVRDTVARLRRARDLLVGRLAAVPGVEAVAPPGAMYLFLRSPGAGDDSLALAKRLASEAGLGLAPGIAFGPEGEGHLRWCFAAAEPLIEEGVRRLAQFLRRML
ncbi:MAG: pyridoxal phosphate-dependent aminotransferase [Burkholderiaceae bacterium]|nr:pyridoxal phosphate-dependent aminotransferase [Burkholderiaceae bacterium]